MCLPFQLYCINVTTLSDLICVSLSASAEDNQPYLSVPCSDHKITSAVWGPLGEFVIAGHENGEFNQFSAKVLRT